MHRRLFVFALLTAWFVETSANTCSSVEPMANPSVVDTSDLRSQSLEIREAFAQRLFSCGAVDDVLEAPEESAALFELVGTIDDELFSSDNSGYTQFAGACLTLRSLVPDQQFIDG